MAIVRKFDYAPFDDSDPDDFRPDSRWAVLVDPGEDHGARVDDITLIVEEIAPGDRIPLHVRAILHPEPRTTRRSRRSRSTCAHLPRSESSTPGALRRDPLGRQRYSMPQRAGMSLERRAGTPIPEPFPARARRALAS